jgi:hypothetical protein
MMRHVPAYQGENHLAPGLKAPYVANKLKLLSLA